MPNIIPKIIPKPDDLPLHMSLDFGMISWQVIKSIAPPANPKHHPINAGEISPKIAPIKAPTPMGRPARIVYKTTRPLFTPPMIRGVAMAIPSGIL